MPIFRIGSKLIFFAHVPKCAGTAVEHYLRNHFGELAFWDSAFNRTPRELRWSRTSPQHIDAESLARLFPESFFDATFAMVRHPVPRLASVFQFQREIEGSIAPEMQFEEWLASLKHLNAADFDNHTRPMCEMVPSNAIVFQIESGWLPMLEWLQGIAGTEIVLPMDMPERNVLKNRLKLEGREYRDLLVSDQARRLIEELYSADFQRFGYDLRTASRP